MLPAKGAPVYACRGRLLFFGGFPTILWAGGGLRFSMLILVNRRTRVPTQPWVGGHSMAAEGNFSWPIEE